MIQSTKEVLEEVYDRYNKDPSGWHVTLSVDHKSRSVVLIQKDKNLWQIKTHHINPYSNISLGGKARVDKRKESSILSFGWRNLSHEIFQKIRNDMKNNGEVSIELLEEIANIEPQEVDKDAKRILEGPFNFSSSPVSAISKQQKELDKKLTLELDKLLFKKEGGMYG